MIFRNFAENLLGSKVKIKLIRYLLNNNTVTSEREISQLLEISHAAVNRTLKELQELNLITPLRAGNIISWQLNDKSYAHEFLVNFFYYLKDKDPFADLLYRIKNHFFDNNKDVKKVVLFGSVAEGRELSNSDIDIFILVENENQRKTILDYYQNNFGIGCLQRYGNVVSLQIFIKKDLENSRNKKFLENVGKGLVLGER